MKQMRLCGEQKFPVSKDARKDPTRLERPFPTVSQKDESQNVVNFCVLPNFFETQPQEVLRELGQSLI